MDYGWTGRWAFHTGDVLVEKLRDARIVIAIASVLLVKV